MKNYQIDHFLAFIQLGGFVQDVASRACNVKLSSGRKAAMPNVVRTVHKAEIVRLYEGMCDNQQTTDLKIGWAIAQRFNRRFTVTQKRYRQK